MAERPATGVTAFRSWLLSIPAQIDELGPFEMVFPAEPERSKKMLLDSMGVAVVIDETVSVPFVRRVKRH